MKGFKKCLSVFMSLFTMFLIPIGKVKAEDVVNMLVICQSQDILDEFEKYLSQYEFDSSIEKLKTHDKGYPICSRGVVKKRVHIEKALYDNEENFKNKYFEKLHEMTQVIIIYDISDPTLDPLVENYSKISGDNWKDLYNMNTFLSNCIRLLMKNSIKDEWYNSFNFLTYNEDKYTNGKFSLDERQQRICHYTCSLELKLHIDNRWGRSNVPYDKCLPGVLSSFSNMMSGFERHKDEFKERKHKDGRYNEQKADFTPNSKSTPTNNPSNNNYNVYKKAGLCVAGASIILGTAYGIYRGAKKLYNHVVSKVKK